MSATIPEIHYLPYSPTATLCLSAARTNLVFMPSWVDQMKEAREWLESRRANRRDDWFATA